jgi:hypothetical protein
MWVQSRVASSPTWVSTSSPAEDYLRGHRVLLPGVSTLARLVA